MEKLNLIVPSINPERLGQYLSEWLYELECPISAELLTKMIKTYIEGDAMANEDFWHGVREPQADDDRLLDQEYNHEPQAYR